MLLFNPCKSPKPGRLLDPEGDGFILQSYKSWDWRYTCPYLRPGRYSVEARFWEAGGTRTVELEPLDVSADAERAIEVPPGS